MADRSDYIFAAVLQNASSLPPEPTPLFYVKMLGNISQISLGVCTNLFSAVALIRSGLVKRITYSMILNLTIGNLLCSFSFGFPSLSGAIAGR